MHSTECHFGEGGGGHMQPKVDTFIVYTDVPENFEG